MAVQANSNRIWDWLWPSQERWPCHVSDSHSILESVADGIKNMPDLIYIQGQVGASGDFRNIV